MHVLEADVIQVIEDLSLDARQVQVLDSQTKKLRDKDTRLVKVFWEKGTQEETWELEDDMTKMYPYMLLEKYNFR